MRDISDVQRDMSAINEEILKIKEKKEPIEKELKTRTAVFQKQTQPLHDKALQLDEEQSKVYRTPSPKLSPYYTLGIIGGILVLIASLILPWHKILKISFALVAAVCTIIVSIVTYVKKERLDKAHREVLKNKADKIEEELQKLYQEIDKIESADPKISELNDISSELSSKQYNLERDLKKLEQEMNEIKLFKKIENSAVIFVINKTHHYKFRAEIITDGNNRGSVGQPFSVIGLTPGIHSLLMEFDTGYQTLRTKTPEQFSLDGNIQYFYYEFFSPSNNKLDVKVVKCNSLSDFLRRSKIPEYKFRDYINSL